MNKLLVSDYDQTFYLNDQDIELNKKAVDKFKEEGNIFVIATGRSYLDFKNKQEQYNFKYDYVILNHGATILDNKDNIIYNFEIEDSIISSIKENLELEKTVGNFCCSILDSRVNFEHKNLTKIHARYRAKEDAMKMSELINLKYSNYINCYYVSGDAIEIISNKTNKSKAISILSNEIGIKSESIYTIGDGYSDIEMIKDFNGYCMEKSIDELKNIAKSYSSVSQLINDIRK